MVLFGCILFFEFIEQPESIRRISYPSASSMTAWRHSNQIENKSVMLNNINRIDDIDLIFDDRYRLPAGFAR